MKETAYKKAGVDIDAGDELVERIKPHVKKTFRPGVMTDLGGFGALFDIKKEKFHDPLLVSSTDGVGTKLKIAIETGIHNFVGTDLVAMSVNDIVPMGAEPLFFLDYFACGRLDVGVAEQVIAGIAQGCRQAGCALVGGETAEMPGMYAPGDYDLAGFCVGAVERGRLIDGSRIREGDAVLGLASSGVHSNGFSLVRRIVSEDPSCRYESLAPFDGSKTLAEILLTPTRIYVRPLLAALGLETKDSHPVIKGMAHITGGGLPENAARMVPDSLALRIDVSRWPLPPVFGWLAQAGKLTADDLARTLNCGIGMVVIVASEDAARVVKSLENSGETVFTIGDVVPRRPGRPPVMLENRDKAWGLKNA